MGLYAADGKCHNSQTGTFGHECGKPAAWIGRKSSGFESGFCAHCKAHGAEARDYVEWRMIGEPERGPLFTIKGGRVGPG